jgi:hypothetical protein
MTTRLHPGSTLEQELKILGSQGLHGGIIRVDGRVDHAGLLLLKMYNSALNRILNAETGNGTRTSLSNAMATICRLPLCSRIPPAMQVSIITK